MLVIDDQRMMVDVVEAMLRKGRLSRGRDGHRFEGGYRRVRNGFGLISCSSICIYQEGMVSTFSVICATGTKQRRC